MAVKKEERPIKKTLEVTNVLSKFVVKTKEGHVDVRVHFRAIDGTWKLTKKISS